MYQRSNIVKHYIRTIAVLAVSLTVNTLAPSLQADGWDKKTNLTIDQSIDVQGTVLPPGTYVMKLLITSNDRNTVQIFNAREDQLFATILATPTYMVRVPADRSYCVQEVSRFTNRARKSHDWDAVDRSLAVAHP